MKRLAYLSIGLLLGSVLITACSGGDNYSSDYASAPTQGLITYVSEVEPDEFKITDEVTIANPDESLIITKLLDGTIDTMTVAMAAAMDTTAVDTTARQRSHRSASRGFFFFMMYRSFSGNRRVSPGAYANNNTYRRVNNNAGNAIRTSRTSGGSRSKSGFGSGKSTRSYGG